jgi:plastocyanin
MLRYAAILALLLSAAAPARAAALDVLVRTPGGQPVPDAVVMVEPVASPPARARPQSRPAAIEQRGAEFQPYVTVVQVGSAVDFPNHDTVRHHVYSFSAPKRFEIKLYSGKPGQPIVFDKPGEVVIGCNIHDWMEAYVLVVETPYFAKTAANGSAAMRELPAGRYRLRLWHPLQKGAAPVREIEVGGAALRFDLVLDARARQPKPHTALDSDRY